MDKVPTYLVALEVLRLKTDSPIRDDQALFAALETTFRALAIRYVHRYTQRVFWRDPPRVYRLDVDYPSPRMSLPSSVVARPVPTFSRPVPWSREENIMLIAGVLRHEDEDRSGQWSSMLRNPQLVFHPSRTRATLRQRYRTLLRTPQRLEELTLEAQSLLATL
jgi:hypothetical protein